MLFDIPKEYIMNSAIEPKTFISRDMKKPEKDRIRDNLLEARLVWQIAGEEIPSLITDEYNCSVIMGLDMKLKAVKDSVFFAELIQRMVKAPCVIRFYDHAEEAFSFAHKRLSLTDNSQIVILDRIETPTLSLSFPDKAGEKLRRYLSFAALLNKSDKLALYLEAAVKAYIISKPKLYSGIDLLLGSKIWYNRPEFMALFVQLKELERLKVELAAAKLPGERAGLMAEIKALTVAIKGE